jgi:hypothetical protein
MDPLSKKVAARFIQAVDEEDDELPMKKVEKHGEWNLHLTKSGSRWAYSWLNPQGGGGGTGSFSSMKAAMSAAMAGVDWPRLAKGKTKVWLIVSHWSGENYLPKKTGWMDIPEALLNKAPRAPLSKEEVWDMMTR